MVNAIFTRHGAVSAIAREIGAPVGTVWSWKQKGEIPSWRRPAVLDAVRRLRIDITSDVLAYLAKVA